MRSSIFKRAINDVKEKAPAKISTTNINNDSNHIFSRIQLKKSMNDRIKQVNKQDNQNHTKSLQKNNIEDSQANNPVEKYVRKIIKRDKDGLITNQIQKSS